MSQSIEHAFTTCVEWTYQKLLASNQKLLAEADPALREQLIQFFRKAAEGSTCSLIKSTCAKDRNGLVCVNYLKKYR